MTHTYCAAVVLPILFLLTGCSTSQQHDGMHSDRVTGEADFERVKSLSGDWYLVGGMRLGKQLEADPDDPFLSYSVSSGGHSVIEKLFVGKPNEMTSIYYLDSGRLMMDHYCSLGNQPRMVAIAGSEDEIPFRLITVGNMADADELHISSHALEFKGPDELTAHWGATRDRGAVSGSIYEVKRMETP